MSITAVQNVTGIEKILRVLPQKYPFLFVDSIVKLETGKFIHTQKAVTFNEWYFQGHFPGNPILPGNIIIEMMGQSAGMMLIDDNDQDMHKPLMQGRLVQCFAKFFHQVRPGVVLDIIAKAKVLTSDCLSANVSVSVANEKVASGEITIAFNI